MSKLKNDNTFNVGDLIKSFCVRGPLYGAQIQSNELFIIFKIGSINNETHRTDAWIYGLSGTYVVTRAYIEDWAIKL